MASVPSDRGPVTGRVDREGRLVEADPVLLRLQEEAGSRMGAPLALPQLAAVARSAMRLGVPLSRSVIAASATQDFDLWVRAEPDADGASLTIDGWKARPPAPPRLTLVGSEPAEGEEMARPSLGFATDAELRLTAIDDALAERLGTSPADAIGQPLTRFLMLVDDGEGQMPLLTALGNRTDFAAQKATPRGKPDQKIILAATSLRSPGGKFAGFDGTADFGDGTGEGLVVFDHALDEALRSPLDRIIAAADHIVGRTDGPLRSDYAAYAGDIAAAGRHLLSVIRAMTEQEAGSESGVDLASAVAEAVQLVQARADTQGVSIAVAHGDEPLVATGEPGATRQILVNILGNAIRHSPAQGTIAVEIERRGANLTVTISDQGPGIAIADQQRIFERYERVGDAPDGTGLGLAIARRLARSMNGEIELVSMPGEGARFILVLRAA
ncbi:MAG: HAMP domain-containing sensor histidine kinase [Sphingomicrobium sp.]